MEIPGILRYPTMLGIAAMSLNITKLPRHRTMTPDGLRSPQFTHRMSSYGVVMAGVTVALCTYTENQ